MFISLIIHCVLPTQANIKVKATLHFSWKKNISNILRKDFLVRIRNKLELRAFQICFSTPSHWKKKPRNFQLMHFNQSIKREMLVNTEEQGINNQYFVSFQYEKLSSGEA